MTRKKQRVLIGLSGGVDSAVSAYLLLKAGYEVEGAFMKNWSSLAGLKVQDCPWLADRQEALRVAAFLGIPLHTLDFEKQYSKRVMDYFFREYKAGRTPNPDVMCNKEIKFKLLYNWVMRHGYDYLATGHYARIQESRIMNHELSKAQSILSVTKRAISPKGGEKIRDSHVSRLTSHVCLMRSADEFKDQTYFIYNIKPEQLPHLLFPIGGMKKTEVKKLAKKIGLPNADRKESMGLCFVGKIRLKDFLKQKVRAKPGPVVVVSNSTSPNLSYPDVFSRGSDRSVGGRGINANSGSKVANVPSGSSPNVGEDRRGMIGKVIGRHNGLHNYTIGQRQGINAGGGGPYYVVKKDLASNTLYVTNDPNDKLLEVSEVVVHSVNWLAEPAYSGERIAYSKTRTTSTLNAKRYPLLARYRHQGKLVPCTVEQLKYGQYKVKFKTPQKALASGQSIVLYSGKVCLGGGVIV